MKRLVIAALAASVACADGAADVVVLDELCGAAEPVRLLALDETEMVTWDEHAVVEHGARLLIGARVRTDITTADIGSDAAAAASRVVSVDACGGEPIEIAADVDTVFLAPRATAPSFACAGGVDRLTWIDPDGVLPSVQVDAIGCRFTWVDDDVVFAVAISEDEDQLVRATFDGFGTIVARDVLVEGLIHWGPRSGFFGRWPVLDDQNGRVIALGADDDLVEIDVRTSESETLRTSVRGFGVHDGIVVYRSGDLRFVWHLDSGVEDDFELVGDSYSSYAEFGGGMATLYDSSTWGRTLLITLDGHERTSMTGTLLPLATTGDGARIVSAHSTQVERGLYRWVPGGDLERFAGPAVEVWTDDELWTISYAYAEHERAQSIVTYQDGSTQPHVVAENVYRPWPWTDDRWLTVRPEIGEVSGPLVLVDPSDGSERIVDDDVHLELARFRGGSNPLLGRAHDDTVTYVVEHGARRGLWRARLGE